VYRTVIETLQSAAWMLLVAFVFLLIAYEIARGMEIRASKRAVADAPSGTSAGTNA
jgi:hypothetical protein